MQFIYLINYATLLLFRNVKHMSNAIKLLLHKEYLHNSSKIQYYFAIFVIINEIIKIRE